MKKLMIVLGVMGLAFTTAEAQQKCGCRAGADNAKTLTVQAPAHKASYAQNFKVCKDNYGYRICGEMRNGYNSTVYVPRITNWMSLPAEETQYARDDYREYDITDVPSHKIAPQNQSYTTKTAAFYLTNEASFTGYAPKKSNIIVGGDNPAHAPYQGENSPQYDGQARNMQRNMKVNSPEQNTTNPELALPPSNGRH